MNELQTIKPEVAGQRTLFDYGALDAETRIVVQQRTSEIKGIVKHVASELVEVGGKLAEVKGRLKNGAQFKSWLDVEFPRWSESTARNLINAWQVYHDADFAIDGIAPSALYLLSAPSTPKAAREMAKQIVDQGEEVSHAAAQEIVRQAKARKPKQEELIEEPEAEEPEATEVRTCRACCCTEADCRRCIERAGAPCVWIGPDLCSACAEPVRVPVPQLVLDAMHKGNSAVAIDRGEPARLFQHGDEWLVITDSTHTVTHGVTFATGWRVAPEAEAGDIHQRSHPSELTDAIAGYAESFLGVRINAKTTDKPEWWVVVGPEYEFEQLKEAAETAEDTSAPAPAPLATPAPVSAQKLAAIKPTFAFDRPASWFKERIEISITLLPGSDAGTRKIMHKAITDEAIENQEAPFVELSIGEDELLAALPPATRRCVEKALAKFASEQSKPKSTTKKTNKSKTKPAAKKPAPKSKTKSKGEKK